MAMGVLAASIASADPSAPNSSVPMVNPEPMRFERVAEPLIESTFENPAPQVRGNTRGAEWCTGSMFDCPETANGGHDQFNFISNGNFVGFGRCDQFDPVENFVTDPDAGLQTLSALCWRGITINGGIAGSPDCSPALNADALVGFRIQVWDTDSLGLPLSAIGLFDTGGIHTNFGGATFNNLTMARFNCGETFANGARPLTTWHADLGLNPQQAGVTGVEVSAGDCFWWGVCWDGTVGGSDFNCTFRWLAYDMLPVTGGDGATVIFDNTPPDGVYTACNLSPAIDFDGSINVDGNDPVDGLDGWIGTTNPPGRVVHAGTVASPCLDASLFLPPANDTCSGAVALTCDTESFHCPIFAVQGPDTINDLMFSCLPAAVHPSQVPSWATWYTVTTTGSELLIDTDPEFNNGWGNIIALFDYTGGAMNPCTDLVNFTEIACNDDFEAGDGLICTSGLTPGRTYYLLCGSDDDLNVGELYVNLICDTNMIPNPANDDCDTAMDIDGLFVANIAQVDNQDTRCAGLDPLASACGGTTNGLAPGLWYSATGDGTNWEISLCNVSACDAAFDTEVNVYCGTCDCGLVCITGDDDGCGTAGGPSITTVCTRPSTTYYIFVHGFFEVGCFDMVVTRNFDALGGCDFMAEPDCNVPAGGGCVVDTSGATYTEVEPCGNDDNGGCTTDPTAVGPGPAEIVDCGDVIAGQCFGENNFRDLDYYSFTLTQRSLVTIALETEFIGSLIIFDSNDCSTNVALATILAEPCTPVDVSLVLDPGGYEFAVTLDNFNGFPCGCANDYVASVTCDPLGACCDSNDDCFVTSSTECGDLGGSFEGGACPTISYTRTESCPETFSSIAGAPFAQVVPFAGLIDAEFYAMPGNLNYFGELKTVVGVTSKGYVSFADVVTITGTPTAIPDATNPNDLAAPLWANIDVINGSAEVWVLVNTAGNETIFEYNACGIFNAFGPQGSNNFQVKINGNTGCIRFVYGSIDYANTAGRQSPSAANTSAGIENSNGTVGNTVSNVALLGSNAGAGAIVCVDFCPQATGTDPCVPAGCDGDADGNMAVNVNDITFIIPRLGMSPGICGDGDVDGNGAVNVNDITYVIPRLGTCNAGGPCN